MRPRTLTDLTSSVLDGAEVVLTLTPAGLAFLAAHRSES